MPQLPPITAPTPYSVVPTQTTEFNELFMTKLQIVADPTTAWTAILNFRNFSYANNQLAPDTVESNHQLVINDLKALAARSSMAAQVCGGLLVMGGLLYQEQSILQTLTPLTATLTAAQLKLTQDQASTSGLTAKLTALQGATAGIQERYTAAVALTATLRSNLDIANALPLDVPPSTVKADAIMAAQGALDQNEQDIAAVAGNADAIMIAQSLISANSVSVVADQSVVAGALAAMTPVQTQLAAVHVALGLVADNTTA
jgi:hypothetical protein